ncbi:MAG: Maf family nucleotide pyrophosphatase [Pseudomonadota bacterium]
MRLILASSSSSRKRMLHAAGAPCEAIPARIDEHAIKEAMLAEEAPPRDIADKLAELKAERIARKFPDALVVGADQVLIQGQRLYDKPNSMAEAADHLRALSGKSHELLSAAVLYEEGKPVWRHIGRAQLIMRPLSKIFIEQYLAEEGSDILECVGAYRLEGRGAQLFTRVQGDYFTVLGLPLLDLLGPLRQRNVLPT